MTQMALVGCYGLRAGKESNLNYLWFLMNVKILKKKKAPRRGAKLPTPGKSSRFNILKYYQSILILVKKISVKMHQ